MTEIFIVEGASGGYEERDTWIVAAYTHHDDAIERAKYAGKRARELHDLRAHDSRGWYDSDEYASQNEYDPNMDMDYYTGVLYYTFPVTLLDKFETLNSIDSRGRIP